MTGIERGGATPRGRPTPPRQPPRRVEVVRTTAVNPFMQRVTVGGDELEGFAISGPACHVKLYLPAPGEREPTLSTWAPEGPRFPSGAARPIIRTYTPRRFDPDARTLELEFVLHGQGPGAAWGGSAQPGDRLAIAGPGRPFPVDPAAPRFLVAGDESALPAIAMIIEALPRHAAAQVIVELAHPAARQELPGHPGVTVTWIDQGAAGPTMALADTVEAAITPDITGWVAGEAAAVRRLRQHILVERALPRSQIVTRVYWKLGASGDDDEDS